MKIALIKPIFPSTNATSIWVNNKHKRLEPCKDRERDLPNRRDFENDLIKKLNAKRFLKYIEKTFKKVNDVSALRYAIIKLKSEKV